MGSIRDRAEGREPRDGPRLGMATGMPEKIKHANEQGSDRNKYIKFNDENIVIKLQCCESKVIILQEVIILQKVIILPK